MSQRERRNFKRIQAPMFWRPEGVLSRLRSTIDVSMGGIRVYSDEHHAVGEHVDMDVVMPDGTWVTFTAEVVWVEKLDAPANFDLGLRFVNLRSDARKKLLQLLDASDE